jgi:hypothetical protein
MITNESDVSLALAVWLLHDEYDYQNMKNYISATSLLKPIRQIILPSRVNSQDRQIDVTVFIARSLGHSIHDSIERAWVKGYERSLKLLGYPDGIIKRVRVNPTDEERKADPNIIPVFLEQRAFREFMGFTIGGKFDLVTDGIVQDAKSTSAFTWVYDGKDDDYRLQMSLYRWIDAVQPMPKITEDFGRVNFIFTDWQKSSARTNPKYPQHRVAHKDIPLLSLKETEQWIRHKLSLVETHKQSPESEIPECTDSELWRSDPAYKYYSDPAKTSGRSTKNFDNMADARAFQSEKSGKGVIITVPGEAKRCAYCDAAPVCSQFRRLFPEA